MSKNTQLSNTSANAEANALAPLFNNGYLRIYSGTQPLTANTALSGNTLLAELRFNATAFPSAANGVLTANAITSETNAPANGTASFFRCYQSDGTTVLMDGSIDISNANMILSTTTIIITQTVICSSFVHNVLENFTGV